MSHTVIKVEDLGKIYRLGQVGTGTIAQDLNRWWYRVRGKEDPYLRIGETNDRTSKGNSDVVWALQNITFDVKQGEVLGIIGKNGAGKSTLLKILSQVTAPTVGSVKVKGRIASLLEVGTGFHPELTGRENIFLNGAILGMTKREIRAKFDEIVAFSGVERYVDTPVKRYSSGMYVRLAFAVAAHLEPEILIIDEVLAVGDAEFQKKCIGKMRDVSSQGRTVLFVSHNMAAVKSLCNKGLLMKQGGVIFQGSVERAVTEYLNSGQLNSVYRHEGAVSTAMGNDNIRLLEFSIMPLHGDNIAISSGSKGRIVFYNEKAGINLDATIELRTVEETPVFHTGIVLSNNNDSKRGIYTVDFELQPNLLNAGVYYFKVTFGENQRYVLWALEDAISFEVLNEAAGSNSDILPGVIRPELNFKTGFHV